MAANPLAQCRVTPAMFAALNEAAAEAGMDRAEYMRALIAAGLEQRGLVKSRVKSRVKSQPDFTQAPCNHAEISNHASPASLSSSSEVVLALVGETSSTSFPTCSESERDPAGPAVVAADAQPTRRPAPPCVAFMRATEAASDGYVQLGDDRQWVFETGAKRGVFVAAAARVKDWPDVAHWELLGRYIAHIKRPSPAIGPWQLVASAKRFGDWMQEAIVYARQLDAIGGDMLRLPRVAMMALNRTGSARVMHIGDAAWRSMSAQDTGNLVLLESRRPDESDWRNLGEWLGSGVDIFPVKDMVTAPELAQRGAKWFEAVDGWVKGGRRNGNVVPIGPMHGSAFTTDDGLSTIEKLERSLERNGHDIGRARS